MIDFEKFIRKLLNAFNLPINITYATPKQDILLLINKLSPKNTNHELIRLGPKSDGGYLVPDDLENIEACFSPGVDMISDFELDCYKRGMQIYLADGSVNKPLLNLSKSEYHFLKKFIGTINNNEFITMDEWVNSASINPNSDLLLQMDIEGNEYSSVLTISRGLMQRFRIIVIEFHKLNKLWNKTFYYFANEVFTKILDTHICVHIHPNNSDGIDVQRGIDIPTTLEFTFLRRDRINQINEASEFPHKLDFDNTTKKSIVLPKIWYN